MLERRSPEQSSAGCKNLCLQRPCRWAMRWAWCTSLHAESLCAEVGLPQGRLAIVLCNLKPRKLAGVSSNGMLLCASTPEHDKVETLAAPAGSEPGERCFFGETSQQQPDPMSPNQVLSSLLSHCIRCGCAR